EEEDSLRTTRFGTIPHMLKHDKPLQGRAVLITGGARRLGRAIALAMAEAGADVAITFRNSARQAQHTVTDVSSFGVRAVALYCDVSEDRKSTRLNSSHEWISYAVFCLKKKRREVNVGKTCTCVSDEDCAARSVS